jgi:hypothetical protein
MQEPDTKKILLCIYILMFLQEIIKKNESKQQK